MNAIYATSSINPETLFLITMGMFCAASFLIALASVIVVSNRVHYHQGDDDAASQDEC